MGSLWFKLWNCYSRSINWGIVTVFKSFLSRKSKHSFNLYQYSKLSQGNNSTNQPIPVNKGSFPKDQILRVITGDGGYFFQTDEHPIEMIEAGCGPGRALCVLPLPNGCPGWKSVYSDNLEVDYPCKWPITRRRNLSHWNNPGRVRNSQIPPWWSPLKTPRPPRQKEKSH